MKVFIEVTNDKYELPVNLEETQRELARKAGVYESAVSKSLKRNRHSGRFQEVEIDDD